MIYNILFEADKHWGATKPEDQYRSSYVLKRLLTLIKPELFVSLGDFYDTKLLLNSRASVYAIRDMHDKAEICRELDIPMRVLRGTLSHDYDQLEAFSSLMQDPKYNFKYFNQFTIEETLPGLKICYAPDENVNWDRWSSLYFTQMMGSKYQLFCAHGNFDVIMNRAALAAIETDDSTTLAFHYNDIIRHLTGPVIAGHYHDGNIYEHLYYAGSADRWIHGEDHVKGFLLVQYDTEKELYRIFRIPNFLATNYRTYVVYTHLYKDAKSYQLLMDDIDKALQDDEGVRVRIFIHINEIFPDTETQILNLKYQYSSNKRVIFTIENEIRTKEKEAEQKTVVQLKEDYAFIREDASPIKTIWKWIKWSTGKEYPYEQLEKILKPELENL